MLDSFFYQSYPGPLKNNTKKIPRDLRIHSVPCYVDCEDLNEGSTMPQARKMKKKEQIKILENEFIKDRNWSKKKIIYLAKILGLTEC